MFCWIKRLRPRLIAVRVRLRRLELPLRRDHARRAREDRAVLSALHLALVHRRHERDIRRVHVGVAPPTRCQSASVPIRRTSSASRLVESSSSARRSSPAKREPIFTTTVSPSTRASAPVARTKRTPFGQRQTDRRALHRRRRCFVELARQERRERRAVVDEREVAVPVPRDRAHVRLVEVEPDPHRGDRDPALGAVDREPLGLRARRVEPVAHEDDAPDPPLLRFAQRAEPHRQPARDVRPAPCFEPANPRGERAPDLGQVGQRLDQLRVSSNSGRTRSRRRHACRA